MLTSYQHCFWRGYRPSSTSKKHSSLYTVVDRYPTTIPHCKSFFFKLALPSDSPYVSHSPIPSAYLRDIRAPPAVNDVSSSYDALFDLFVSIDKFLSGLRTYTEVLLTQTFKIVLVKIIVEFLSTLVWHSTVRHRRAIMNGKNTLPPFPLLLDAEAKVNSYYLACSRYVSSSLGTTSFWMTETIQMNEAERRLFPILNVRI